MKIWSKTDWENYKENVCTATWLEHILAECYKNRRSVPGLGEKILDLVVKYKRELSNKTSPIEYIIGMCNQVLTLDYAKATYHEVALIFGYEISETPVHKTVTGTISAIEHDIACGEFTDSTTSEYLSLAYHELRRNLVHSSIRSECDLSEAVREEIVDIKDRFYVLQKLLPKSPTIPGFMEKLLSFEEEDLKFSTLCFPVLDSTSIYSTWRAEWKEVTRRYNFEWFQGDQESWISNDVCDIAERKLVTNVGVIDSLSYHEIAYTLELLLSVLACKTYTFLSDNGVSNKVTEFDRFAKVAIDSLTMIEPFWKETFDYGSLRDIISRMESLCNNGTLWTEGKVRDFTEPLGIVVYV